MRISRIGLAGALALLLASAGWAQVHTFSADNASPTLGVIPANGGDILMPTPPAPAPGPLPVPSLFIGAGMLGLPVGAAPPEIDALSYGHEPAMFQTLDTWFFSVDRRAVGQMGMMGPSVTTEGAGAGAGAEASADVFVSPLGPGPLPPPLPPIGVPFGINMGFRDGNGLAGLSGFAYAGLGLNAEPNQPQTGDDLDAFDLNTHLDAASKVFYSVDAATALAMGCQPGDILMTDLTQPGVSVVHVYASAMQLGLMQDDNIDALVLFDDGDGRYLPVGAGGNDWLMFSLTPGSPSMMSPDSMWNAPIEAGDILIDMAVLGNTPGSPPGIWVAAEYLGLETIRNGFNNMDNLDALDVVPEPATLALMGLGVAGLVARRRRSK